MRTARVLCLLALLAAGASCAREDVRWSASFGAARTFTATNADAITLSVSCREGEIFTVGIERVSISDRGRAATAAFIIDGVRFETDFEGPEFSNAPILVADFEDAERLNRLGRALLAARRIEWTAAPEFRTAPTQWGPFARDPDHAERVADMCAESTGKTGKLTSLELTTGKNAT